MVIWLFVLMPLSVVFFCTLLSVALNSIPLERLWKLKEAGGRSAAGVEYWITHSQQITWAFRVVSRISCVALALALLTLIAGETLPLYAFIIALVIATILVAFPGSLIPSAWAQHAGERIGLSMLPFIRVLGIILSPLSAGCHTVLNVLLRPFGISGLRFTPIQVRSELDQCVGGIERSGRLTPEEKKMIRRIFSLGDVEASDIMTPRVSFRSLSEGDNLGRALELIKAEQYSRMPVYRGNPDNIVGILYAKDLLGRCGPGAVPEGSVRDLIREPLFVPETIKVRALFSEMRKRQLHMAIVVDEYGGATGLVTMEDILEDIVGEIRDEYDAGEPKLYEKVADGVYHVDARLSVNDAREELGLHIPERRDYDTFAGFVCAHLGRVPAAGESFEWGGATIKVLEATRMGVQRVEVRAGKGAEGKPGDGI